MSKLMDNIMASAKARNKCIVLPEGEEIRIIQAAEIINKQKIARVVGVSITLAIFLSHFPLNIAIFPKEDHPKAILPR